MVVTCSLLISALIFFAPCRAHGSLAARAAFSAVQFRAADGVQVTADLYSTGRRDAPTIVLVHQSGSSRGEYRQIARRLVRLGFNALAVDTRWGERDPWNRVRNETAARFGTSAIIRTQDRSKMRPVQEASANDVRAALSWLRQNRYSGPKLLWGSSISANLVLKIASKDVADIAGVLAFSPGEYHPDAPHELRSTVTNLKIPVLIACGAEEQKTSFPIFEALPNPNAIFYRAVRGEHGSSILLDDPRNWAGVEPFLQSIKKQGRR